MDQAQISKPADGSRIYTSDYGTILFGQPPEVLKGLLKNNIYSFDTLVLPDIREKDGSLTNNLEFPLYFFLFVSKGLEQNRLLNLVGDADHISHMLRLLRICLLGPTPQELFNWETDINLAQDWLNASIELAIKDKTGSIIPAEGFVNVIPFTHGKAQVGQLTITHLGIDRYEVSASDSCQLVDLNEDTHITPPYHVDPDYVPGGLVKFGIEVLGGASGFSPDEPCTGLAICHNGEYILVDAMPFLDQHLFARGISKNQITAVFLTHLHDDHCSLFPLMTMPHPIDLITTTEIFTMAIDKLACALGWAFDVVASYFNHVDVKVGGNINYYGLMIDTHATVHSIPTIGATFSNRLNGLKRSVCVIGDNHSMTAVKEMAEKGLIREQTAETLELLYKNEFSLLIADGGAGAIHGDTDDAIHSKSERVVFIHVEELSGKFNTTFSLASAGKRYTLFPGDPAIYSSQVSHYLSAWLGRPFPIRWMRNLLAEQEVKLYNMDDVILVQDQITRGMVYLVVTGYCEVVHHDGSKLQLLAKLQAGDLLGEMAVITGIGIRNASVVARTPVTLCAFSEETFNAFIATEGLKNKLLVQWSLRPLVSQLPQFKSLSSTVLDKLAQVGRITEVSADQGLKANESQWHILFSGEAQLDGKELQLGDECGIRPFHTAVTGHIETTGSRFVSFRSQDIAALLKDVPQLNYTMRKYRESNGGKLPGDKLPGEKHSGDKHFGEKHQSWSLGPVTID